MGSEFLTGLLIVVQSNFQVQKWPGQWQRDQIKVLCRHDLDMLLALPNPPIPLQAFKCHQQVLLDTVAEDHDHSALLFHITAWNPPLLPLAHILSSDSQWHLSLLLIHYPSILASRGLLVALAIWNKWWNFMVNPETLYGGVISWFWFPSHFYSAEAKNTSKKQVWQRAPTPNSLHSN